MASFEERSISSKVDSSDAETNENCSKKLRLSHLNVANSEFSMNNPSDLTMTDHLSTMDNVIVSNRVQLQSMATNNDTTIHSDTSSEPMDCNNINVNDGNFEAENIVSSTQETVNDATFNLKLCSDKSNCIINNKCDVTLDKKLQAMEQHITINEQSHVAVTTANALSSQNRKMMDDEPKRHLHISDSSKTKTKSLESGTYEKRLYKRKKKEKKMQTYRNMCFFFNFIWNQSI